MCIDIRQATSGDGLVNPLFSFRAHDETTSSVSFSTLIPGMMATSSVDNTVKVWDVLDASRGSGSPRPVAYKTMNVGKIFTMGFSPDTPYLLACGGDSGVVAVWESDELDVIRKYFSGRGSDGERAIVSASLSSEVETMSLLREPEGENDDGNEAKTGGGKKKKKKTKK